MWLHPEDPAMRTLVVIGFLALLSSGCVRRVHEAPGLPPNSPLAVRADMRVETFEVETREVRVFRFPLTGGNNRRYQFAVLLDGRPEFDIMVERSGEESWALVERRPDGISITHQTWTAEPSYTAAKAAVVTILRDREGR
jgi:hypothetical protein